MLYEVWLPPVQPQKSFWRKNRHSSQPLTLVERQEKAVFLRQGLSFLAFLLPEIWLLWNRLWYAFLVVLLFGAIMFALSFSGYPLLARLLGFMPALYLLFEGMTLLSRRFENKGYVYVATVSASSRANAEIRYFHDIADLGNKMEGEGDMLPSISPNPQNHVPNRPKHNTGSHFGLFAD